MQNYNSYNLKRIQKQCGILNNASCRKFAEKRQFLSISGHIAFWHCSSKLYICKACVSSNAYKTARYFLFEFSEAIKRT